MTDDNFEKAMLDAKPRDLHWRPECNGEMNRCGAHKTWCEGAQWAKSYLGKEIEDLKAITSREMEKIHQGRPSAWAYKILEQERNELRRIKAEEKTTVPEPIVAELAMCLEMIAHNESPVKNVGLVSKNLAKAALTKYNNWKAGRS